MYLITAKVSIPDPDQDVSTDRGFYFKGIKVKEVILYTGESVAEMTDVLKTMPTGTYYVYNLYRDAEIYEVKEVIQVEQIFKET